MTEQSKSKDRYVGEGPLSGKSPAEVLEATKFLHSPSCIIMGNAIDAWYGRALRRALKQVLGAGDDLEDG